mgnify:CR=1 FL=1
MGEDLGTADFWLDAIADADPYPYWHDDVDEPDSNPTLVRTENCDLCIVGGGYTGLWTAIIAKERARVEGAFRHTDLREEDFHQACLPCTQLVSLPPTIKAANCRWIAHQAVNGRAAPHTRGDSPRRPVRSSA